jgi:hypothetical protein
VGFGELTNMANQGDDSRDVNDVTWIQIPETHIMVKEGVRNEEGVRNVYYYATTTEDLMQVADATQTEAQIMEIINASSILQEHKNAMARNVQAKVKLVPAELAASALDGDDDTDKQNFHAIPGYIQAHHAHNQAFNAAGPPAPLVRLMFIATLVCHSSGWDHLNLKI